jgi:hypothetical protein
MNPCPLHSSKGNLQLLDDKSISAKLDMEDEDGKDDDDKDKDE